jgi:hypothetical protein
MVMAKEVEGNFLSIVLLFLENSFLKTAQLFIDVLTYVIALNVNDQGDGMVNRI